MIRRLWSRWVGCDVCRSRHQHRSIIRHNQRLTADFDRRWGR